MQAAWWVEYVCRHGTANWLKSIGEEVVKMLVMMVVMMVTMMAMTMVVIGNKEICRQCVNYFLKMPLHPLTVFEKHIGLEIILHDTLQAGALLPVPPP